MKAIRLKGACLAVSMAFSSQSKNQIPRTKFQEPNSKNQIPRTSLLFFGSWLFGILDFLSLSWQDRHAVIGNPHFPVALAARAAKPGPLHRHDLGIRAAPKDGRQQAAGPSTVLVAAGHRIAGQHSRLLRRWASRR